MLAAARGLIGFAQTNPRPAFVNGETWVWIELARRRGVIARSPFAAHQRFPEASIIGLTLSSDTALESRSVGFYVDAPSVIRQEQFVNAFKSIRLRRDSKNQGTQ